MRVGVLGGTFDPVHFGHLLLAQCCLEQCRLDQVWFLPAAVPPHKQARPLTPANLRIEMLELALAGNESFLVSHYETDRGGVNYTAATLAHFQEEDPGRELFFLLGADMLRDLPKWREPGKICHLALVVAVGRAGEPPVDFSLLAGLVSPERLDLMRRHKVEMPAIGLSGSEIRRRVAAGQNIRYRTPRAVEKYVETKGLYRGIWGFGDLGI